MILLLLLLLMVFICVVFVPWMDRRERRNRTERRERWRVKMRQAERQARNPHHHTHEQPHSNSLRPDPNAEINPYAPTAHRADVDEPPDDKTEDGIANDERVVRPTAEIFWTAFALLLFLVIAVTLIAVWTI